MVNNLIFLSLYLIKKGEVKFIMPILKFIVKIEQDELPPWANNKPNC